MIDHVSLGVRDLARSQRFYDAALRPLGLVRIVDFEGRGSDYGSAPASLGVEFTITEESGVVSSRGMHICFLARDRDAVATFHNAALANGGEMTVLLACARSTMQATTVRSCSTPTATASKLSATPQNIPNDSEN